MELGEVRATAASWILLRPSSAEWAHPEIEYVWIGGPSPGSWRGTVGMAATWRELLSAWEDLRTEAEEYRELDEERVQC
jgi:hypothetical protein